MEHASFRFAQKVNEKNSWQLDFIDHMGRMLEDPSGGASDEMTNFLKASTTLDAGVKIYSYRVDSVYTETYKLLGGVSRTEKRPDEALDEAEEGTGEAGDADDADATGLDGEGERAGAKKGKKASSGAAGTKHLETNPAALNLKKIDLGFQVDPLFHRTSAKFDEGGAKGLLLNNLPTGQGCRVVFDSSDAQERSGPDEAPGPSARLPLSTLSEIMPQQHKLRTQSTVPGIRVLE